MPIISAPPKIAATRGYGATVVFSGPTSTEREAATKTVIDATGATFIPPYDHPDIIAGQGTAALEFQSQVAEMLSSRNPPYSYIPETPAPADRRLNAIITPCGGGGLLS